MMKCKPYQTEIEESEASAGLKPELRVHLDACALCRKFYDERTALKRLVGNLERVSAPNDFEFRLRARLAATENNRRRGLLRRSLVPGMASVVLASIFALAVGLAFQFRQKTESSPATASVPETAPPSRVNEVQAPEEVVKSNAVLSPTVAVEKVRKSRAVNSTHAASARQIPFVAANNAVGLKSRKNKLGTSDFSLRPAPSVGVPINQMALTNFPIAVALHRSQQPLRVVLRDRRGAERVVPMKSVSFGAQQLVGQVNKNARDTVESKEVVW